MNGSKIGHITWSLSKLKSLAQLGAANSSKLNSSLTHLNQPHQQLPDSLQIENINKSTSNSLNESNTFTKRLHHDDMLEFRYYTGSKANTCLASSIHLRVILPNSNINGSSSSSSSSSFESFPSPSVSSSLALNSVSKANENEFITFKISGKFYLSREI